MEFGLIIGGAFLLFVVPIIGIFLVYEKIKKKNFIHITGKCVKIEKWRNGECPVFQIYLNGHYKNICNSHFTNSIIYNVGDEYELLINPKDTNDFYIKNDTDDAYTKANINETYLVFGYIVFIISLVIILSGLGFGDIIVMVVTLAAIALIFVYILFINLKDFIIKKYVCTLEIQAKIVEVKRKHNNDKHYHIYYTPIYEIYYNGRIWKITNNSHSEKCPNIGDVVNIKINPNNPKEFIDKIWYSSIYCSMGVSFGLLIVILYALISGLSK